MILSSFTFTSLWSCYLSIFYLFFVYMFEVLYRNAPSEVEAIVILFCLQNERSWILNWIEFCIYVIEIVHDVVIVEKNWKWSFLHDWMWSLLLFVKLRMVLTLGPQFDRSFCCYLLALETNVNIISIIKQPWYQ